ncbi:MULTISPECIES: RHS repeat-associated core domain-containing protein [Xanthomonas]|uniref:RHS repeat-associated core domain-containing protein n=1 Tax=Xanthomonas TaxID=338 RepID=UPI001ADA7E90|nr:MULTISPECIES: RHS repeat-associated core domain-containing protein [unclassified Xanthomonas]MBO9872956.1 RHS repeat-associated core domain-containing protein [Xanthomonas sp. D-93]WNH44827.1 RHS repeat-associated core domain-containing protein [Xanthomonas sp. A6251]
MSNFHGIHVALRLLAATALSLFVAFGASAQTVRYVHTDGLGSVVLITDKDRNVVERSEYEPYGGLLNRPITNMPGYTGHVMDMATGLTYMEQRYYDQELGRFLSVDPIAVRGEDGFNRYWYANNNPYKFVDLDGRESFLVSRPLNFYGLSKIVNHNFIVHNASAPGDPNATVRSFGITTAGPMGEVTSSTEGPNANTSAMDRAAWESIGTKGSDVTFRKIEATDDVVKSVSDSISSSFDYSYVPEVSGGFNSNSAAGAIAQESDGGSPRVDNGKLQPGSSQEKVNSARKNVIIKPVVNVK